MDLINKDQKKCRKGDVMIIGKKRWVNFKVTEYIIHNTHISYNALNTIYMMDSITF